MRDGAGAEEADEARLEAADHLRAAVRVDEGPRDEGLGVVGAPEAWRAGGAGRLRLSAKRCDFETSQAAGGRKMADG